jgi:hypothetical protein
MSLKLKDGVPPAIITLSSRLVKWSNSLRKTRSLTESKGIIPQVSTLPTLEESTVTANLKITVQKPKK